MPGSQSRGDGQLRPFSKGFSHILKEWRRVTEYLEANSTSQEKDRKYVADIPVVQPRLPRIGERRKQTQANVGSDIKTDTAHTFFVL